MQTTTDQATQTQSEQPGTLNNKVVMLKSGERLSRGSSFSEADQIDRVAKVLRALTLHSNLREALLSISPYNSDPEATIWTDSVLAKVSTSLPMHLQDQLKSTYEYTKPWTEEVTSGSRRRSLSKMIGSVMVVGIGCTIATVYYLGFVAAYHYLAHVVSSW